MGLQQKLFSEKPKQLIKTFVIEGDMNLTYIISTIMHIMNRWKKIRIYFYDISKDENNNETKKNN